MPQEIFVLCGGSDLKAEGCHRTVYRTDVGDDGKCLYCSSDKSFLEKHGVEETGLEEAKMSEEAEEEHGQEQTSSFEDEASDVTGQ